MIATIADVLEALGANIMLKPEQVACIHPPIKAITGGRISPEAGRHG